VVLLLVVLFSLLLDYLCSGCLCKALAGAAEAASLASALLSTHPFRCVHRLLFAPICSYSKTRVFGWDRVFGCLASTTAEGYLQRFPEIIWVVVCTYCDNALWRNTRIAAGWTRKTTFFLTPALLHLSPLLSGPPPLHLTHHRVHIKLLGGVTRAFVPFIFVLLLQ